MSAPLGCLLLAAACCCFIEAQVQVYIGLAGDSATVNVSASDTIDDIKAKLASLTDIPQYQQRLTIAGKQCYLIVDGSRVPPIAPGDTSCLQRGYQGVCDRLLEADEEQWGAMVNELGKVMDDWHKCDQTMDFSAVADGVAAMIAQLEPSMDSDVDTRDDVNCLRIWEKHLNWLRQQQA